jgi:SAM-dependent methyltransferase
MVSYTGRHAKLYDIFYAEKPYKEEAAFVHSCIQQYGIGTTNTILELACGTGSHAFALESFGYKITASDSSRDMLQCAKEKGVLRQSSVNFRLQDMREWDNAGGPYDAMICLFDSIGYVVTNPGLLKVLQGVSQNLRPNGLFIFEFWHAAAMIKSYSPLRVRKWEVPEGEILRVSETELDIASQLAKVNYSVFELRNDGTYLSFQESQVNRYFLIQEMENWLSRCSFDVVKWFSGYSNNETIDDRTWHIVAVARLQA